MNYMKSYIKLYGPPVVKALEALEKMAIDMPEVCVMDSLLGTAFPQTSDTVQQEGVGMTPGGVYDYFIQYGEIEVERCNTIISKRGEELGEYDFFFEWFKDPDHSELKNLIQDIDEVLEPIGIRYSIVTK